MTKVLCAWLLAVSVGLAGATNEITGAFGVKFGEPFAFKSAETTGGTELWHSKAFTPTNAAAPFEKFEASMLSGSEVVFMISAYSGKIPRKESKEKFNEIAGRLAEKHGTPQVSFDESDIGMKSWTNGTRSILLNYDVKIDGNCIVSVTYTDEELAEKLRAKVKAGKAGAPKP